MKVNVIVALLVVLIGAWVGFEQHSELKRQEKQRHVTEIITMQQRCELWEKMEAPEDAAVASQTQIARLSNTVTTNRQLDAFEVESQSAQSLNGIKVLPKPRKVRRSVPKRDYISQTGQFGSLP